MLDLDKRSLPELEALAADLRNKIGENSPSSSAAELKDVEWELEKRQWRRKS